MSAYRCVMRCQVWLVIRRVNWAGRMYRVKQGIILHQALWRTPPENSHWLSFVLLYPAFDMARGHAAHWRNAELTLIGFFSLDAFPDADEEER